MTNERQKQQNRQEKKETNRSIEANVNNFLKRKSLKMAMVLDKRRKSVEETKVENENKIKR